MIRTSTKCLRCILSCGNINKKIVKSWWRLASRDGKLGKLLPGLGSFILDTTWGLVRLVTCQNLTFSTRRYWQGTTSRKDCTRIFTLPTSSCGFLLGFSQCVWCWIAEKWLFSLSISLECCLMSAKGHSRSCMYNQFYMSACYHLHTIVTSVWHAVFSYGSYSITKLLAAFNTVVLWWINLVFWNAILLICKHVYSYYIMLCFCWHRLSIILRSYGNQSML